MGSWGGRLTRTRFFVNLVDSVKEGIEYVVPGAG
jgi:hypothetical protein